MKPDPEIAERLFLLELALLNPDVRRSEAAADLLAEDFVEFGSSGRRFDKSQIVALLQQEPAVTLSATDMSATQLAEGVVLVTYHACREGEYPVYSLRSSIWQLRGVKWQIVFHQGTLSGRD